MRSTLESKQEKIDQLLRSGIVVDEMSSQKRNEVAQLFEKDIMSLSDNIVG